MAAKSTFFDGKSAASHTASVSLRPDRLDIRLDGQTLSWSYDGLVKAGLQTRKAQALRLTHKTMPGSRLIIHDRNLIEAISQRAPHLSGRFNTTRAVKIAVRSGLIASMVLLSIYVIFNYAPGKIASFMSDEFRDKMGRQTEKSVTAGKSPCTNRPGQRALLKLASRVAAGSTNPPDFSIRVYDMDVLNAFAVAGGRIVLTSKLVSKVDTDDELAGIIAHELGHVYFRHPEAALVRILGVQLLVTAITGSGDTGAVATFSVMAALLKYSRSAERQADGFAQRVLIQSDIDPAGLRRFFEKVKKLQDRSILGNIPSIFTTHPNTAGRIKQIKPLAPGKARPILTENEWIALKNICSNAGQTGTNSS